MEGEATQGSSISIGILSPAPVSSFAARGAVGAYRESRIAPGIWEVLSRRATYTA